MYNFLGQKYSDIPTIYITYKKNQHIFMEKFGEILLEHYDILGQKNQVRKTDKIHKGFLNYIKS